MTVLVLSLSDIPRDRRVDALCRSLGQSGHDVVACGFGRPAEAAGYRLKPIRRGRPSTRALGIAIRQWPAAYVPILARLGYGLDAELGRMSHHVGLIEPDLVWACGFATLPFGVEVKRRLGARLVYDGLAENPAAGAASDGRFTRFRDILEGASVPLADHVVAGSASTADALVRTYGLQSRPTVIADEAPLEAWLDIVDGFLPRDRSNP